MSQFEIAEFEKRVDALLGAYQRLLGDYRALEAIREAEQQRYHEARDRLHSVIERIRALEAEADNA